MICRMLERVALLMLIFCYAYASNWELSAYQPIKLKAIFKPGEWVICKKYDLTNLYRIKQVEFDNSQQQYYYSFNAHLDGTIKVISHWEMDLEHAAQKYFVQPFIEYCNVATGDGAIIEYVDNSFRKGDKARFRKTQFAERWGFDPNLNSIGWPITNVANGRITLQRRDTTASIPDEELIPVAKRNPSEEGIIQRVVWDYNWKQVKILANGAKTGKKIWQITRTHKITPFKPKKFDIGTTVTTTSILRNSTQYDEYTTGESGRVDLVCLWPVDGRLKYYYRVNINGQYKWVIESALRKAST